MTERGWGWGRGWGVEGAGTPAPHCPHLDWTWNRHDWSLHPKPPSKEKLVKLLVLASAPWLPLTFDPLQPDGRDSSKSVALTSQSLCLAVSQLKLWTARPNLNSVEAKLKCNSMNDMFFKPGRKKNPCVCCSLFSP